MGNGSSAQKTKFEKELSIIHETLTSRKDSIPKSICNEIVECVYGKDPSRKMSIKISQAHFKGMHLSKDKGIKEIVVYGYNKPPDLIEAAKVQQNYAINLDKLSVDWDNDSYLCQHDSNQIYDGCTLFVRKGIYIKTLTGKTIICTQLEWDQTIKTQICTKIQDEIGVSPDEQRLIFAGRQLDINRTLRESNLEYECTLHLILRLKK